jgi:LmbE family N-acetylglucosaminyl deacetylase
LEINSFDPKGKKFLVITAHADDADFCAGGTMLKWLASGAKGAIVIATNGDKGTHNPKLTSSELADLRKEEQIAASKFLGFEYTWFLNYLDSHLEVTQELKSRLVKIIRKYKPDAILTWDPTMVYSLKREMVNHTDHRAIGQAALDAVYPLSRDHLTFPEHLKEEGLTSHFVSDLFLFNFENYNYLEETEQFIEKKIKLLKFHKSQIDKEKIAEFVKNWSSLFTAEGLRFAESFVHFTFKKD